MSLTICTSCVGRVVCSLAWQVTADIVLGTAELASTRICISNSALAHRMQIEKTLHNGAWDSGGGDVSGSPRFAGGGGNHAVFKYQNQRTVRYLLLHGLQLFRKAKQNPGQECWVL